MVAICPGRDELNRNVLLSFVKCPLSNVIRSSGNRWPIVRTQIQNVAITFKPCATKNDFKLDMISQGTVEGLITSGLDLKRENLKKQMHNMTTKETNDTESSSA